LLLLLLLLLLQIGQTALPIAISNLNFQFRIPEWFTRREASAESPLLFLSATENRDAADDIAILPARSGRVRKWEETNASYGSCE
jgi:hypothetical protein